jgi:hypothetical protein
MSPGRVRRRTWTKRGPTGHQIKVTSWGFTVQVNGKQQKRFNAEWTKEEAQEELAKFILEKDRPKVRPITLADAADRYEQAKVRKRSLREDKNVDLPVQSPIGRGRASLLDPEVADQLPLVQDDDPPTQLLVRSFADQSLE